MKQETFRKFASSYWAKIIVGFVLVIILMVPMGMIRNLTIERDSSHESVKREISKSWGAEQILSGPYLEVPYSYERPSSSVKNTKETISGSMTFLPERLNIDADIEPEEKHRGIYKLIVYNGDFKISGNFKMPKASQLKVDDKILKIADFDWENSQFKFYVTETKGITNNLKVDWNKESLEVYPELKKNASNSKSNTQSEGFACDVNFINDSINKFSFEMDLKGSSEISFIPLGKYSTITTNALWPSPHFTGNYFPDHHQESKNDFSANWSISHLNRPIKQVWDTKEIPHFNNYTFGVKLLEPIDKYHKTMRASKYAILFILLTFITLFFAEIISKRSNNILQYLLTGLALILFYSLLLSLTEHMHFNQAYFITSFSIISLITIYNYSISRDRKMSIILLALWSLLYGFLFFILQLEEMALLAGNIGLFIILALIMFTSRKINFRMSKKGDSDEERNLNMSYDNEG